MAYRDPAVGRAADRERFHKRTAEWRAAGICTRYGKTEPAPRRTVCAACAKKRNRASRAWLAAPVFVEEAGDIGAHDGPGT